MSIQDKYWYFVEPQDVWMFREAKPFAAGQSFVARSLFPPTPQTLQGIIRSTAIEQEKISFADYVSGANQSLWPLIGRPDSLYPLAIEGPFVSAIDGNSIIRLLPAPQDLLVHKQKSPQEAPVVVMAPQKHYKFLTNKPFENWHPLGADISKTDNYENATGWLTDTEWLKYLGGGNPSLIQTSDLYVREEHVGLGLDYTRRANREGHLYHAEFIRPQESVGFMFSINQGALIPQGYMTVGGETRGAKYEKIEYAPPKLAPATFDHGRLKVVLLTPAYFKDGWQPVDANGYLGDWSPWVGREGRLVAVAIGKALPISGWDLANNKARPQYNYIPAGSVFFFEEALPPSRPFTQTPDFPDDDPMGLEWGRMGFGGFEVGTWNWNSLD